MTSVSVVIPCYNYGRFLENAVTSVLDDQEGIDVRVLIIDDASPDDSADVARKIAARDPRVEVVVHPANKGHIATYNEGLLEWADGDYCILLSADDWLIPGALRHARDLLDAHPAVGFVYGKSLWVEDGAPLPMARTRLRGWSVWPGQWWLERRFRQAHNCVPATAVVVRTPLQQRVGGYDGRLTHSGDMEMWMRLAANADVGYLRGVDQAYARGGRSHARAWWQDGWSGSGTRGRGACCPPTGPIASGCSCPCSRRRATTSPSYRPTRRCWRSPGQHQLVVVLGVGERGQPQRLRVEQLRGMCAAHHDQWQKAGRPDPAAFAAAADPR